MRDVFLTEPDPTASPAGWHARLSLGFAGDDGATRMVRCAHAGPLRVQKALYPEGPRTCHVIVVHPPGGVAGGDALDIDLDLQPGAHVLATTPGAGKWYRAGGRPARQDVRVRVGAGAALEWLPQEAIFYDGADVRLVHDVELDAGARYLGMDILCFGRRAFGEHFARGRVAQRTRIRSSGRTVWWEQGRIEPETLDSPLGLGGRVVCATLLAVGKPVPPALRDALRATDPGLALSQVKSVFVARHIGDDAEAARACLLRVWQRLRPLMLDMPAVVPRIWHT